MQEKKKKEKEKERTKSDYKFVLDILSSKNQDLNPYAVGIVSLLIPQMGLYMRKRGLIDKGTDLTQGHLKKL